MRRLLVTRANITKATEQIGCRGYCDWTATKSAHIFQIAHIAHSSISSRSNATISLRFTSVRRSTISAILPLPYLLSLRQSKQMRHQSPLPTLNGESKSTLRGDDTHAIVASLPQRHSISHLHVILQHTTTPPLFVLIRIAKLFTSTSFLKRLQRVKQQQQYLIREGLSQEGRDCSYGRSRGDGEDAGGGRRDESDVFRAHTMLWA